MRTINSPARELVNQRLPFGIHFNELGRHTLYVVLKAKQPTRQLLDMGLEVTSHDGFETARAGWADAARRVDILITDVSLGDGCGLELAKESMNDDRCRSVLILTGHADMDRLSSMIETYKWGLLLKPFGAAELRDKVRERLQSL